MDSIALYQEKFLTWITETASTKELAGLCLGVLFLLYALYSSFLAFRTRHIPGPPAWPIAGHIPYLLSEPWMRFAEFAAKYGALYKLWVWNKLFIVVSDPAVVKEMFADKSELGIYPKDQWSYENMRPILGWGLVTSEGKIWADHKKLLKPAFEFEALKRLHEVFTGAANRFHDKLTTVSSGKALPVDANNKLMGHGGGEIFSHDAENDGAIVELSAAFRQVTLEVISQVALGLNPTQANVFPQLFEAVLDELNERLFAPWRDLFFWPGNAEYRARLGKLNSIVYGMIKERRALREQNPTKDVPVASEEEGGLSISGKPIFGGGGDMLDMILDSGASLTDREIADEIKTQLLAGHETSSMMLCWACYLLARNPAALEKAYEEVDRVLGLVPGVKESPVAESDRRYVPSDSEEISFRTYRELTYLECVLKEAMRVYTPVPVLTREVAKDDVLECESAKGTFIPKGARIMVSIWALHTDPKIWGDDVAEFKPERHLRENSKGRHSFAFIPFSAGPRVCIGQNLAITEGKVVLATILRNFKLSVLDEKTEMPRTDKYIIPVRPHGGLHVRMVPRK